MKMAEPAKNSTNSRTAEHPPLARAKLARIRTVQYRLERLQPVLLTATQWVQSDPVASLPPEAQPLVKHYRSIEAKIDDAIHQAIMAANPASWLFTLAAAPAASASSEDNLAAMLEDPQRLSKASTAIRWLVVKLNVAAQTLSSAVAFPGERSTWRDAFDREVLIRQSSIQQSAAMLLADATWLLGLSAKIAAKGLDAREANASRVAKHRRRRREGFATVTTSYHASDLDGLKRLGFLPTNGPYDDQEVSAAFEALQQAAMAIVRAEFPNEPSDMWLRGVFGSWVDRMAILADIEGAEPANGD